MKSRTKIQPQSFALRLKQVTAELEVLRPQLVESVFGHRRVLSIERFFDHGLAIEKVFFGANRGQVSRIDIFREVVFGIGLQQNPELTMAASFSSLANYARVLWARLKLYSLLQSKTGRDALSRQDLSAFLRSH